MSDYIHNYECEWHFLDDYDDDALTAQNIDQKRGVMLFGSFENPDISEDKTHVIVVELKKNNVAHFLLLQHIADYSGSGSRVDVHLALTFEKLWTLGCTSEARAVVFGVLYGKHPKPKTI